MMEFRLPISFGGGGGWVGGWVGGRGGGGEFDSHGFVGFRT